MKCKECGNLYRLKNTDSCGVGVCSYPSSYVEVNIENDCLFTPSPYTCKDCDHYRTHDTACMTAKADDLVGDCPGFVDNKKVDMYNIMVDWKLRGFNVKDKLEEVYKEFEEEFKAPF